MTKDAVMSEYSDVFGGELGRMEGNVHLESDPNVAPTVMPPRCVPVAHKEKLKNELDPLTQRTEREVESGIHAVDYLDISEQQLSKIKQETAKDPTLQILKSVILRGWPENGSSVPKEVSEFLNAGDELAVRDGITFKGQ